MIKIFTRTFFTSVICVVATHVTHAGESEQPLQPGDQFGFRNSIDRGTYGLYFSHSGKFIVTKTADKEVSGIVIRGKREGRKRPLPYTFTANEEEGKTKLTIYSYDFENDRDKVQEETTIRGKLTRNRKWIKLAKNSGRTANAPIGSCTCLSVNAINNRIYFREKLDSKQLEEITTTYVDARQKVHDNFAPMKASIKKLERFDWDYVDLSYAHDDGTFKIYFSRDYKNKPKRGELKLVVDELNKLEWPIDVDGDDPREVILGLQRLGRVYLDMRGHQDDPSIYELITKLANAQQIDHLYLKGFTNEALDAITPLADKLERLTLGRPFGEIKRSKLQNLSKLKKLKRFELNAVLENAGNSVLSHLKKLPELEDVKVTTEDLSAMSIMAVNKMPKLKRLDLHGGITPEEMTSIENPNLESLILFVESKIQHVDLLQWDYPRSAFIYFDTYSYQVFTPRGASELLADLPRMSKAEKLLMEMCDAAMEQIYLLEKMLPKVIRGLQNKGRGWEKYVGMTGQIYAKTKSISMDVQEKLEQLIAADQISKENAIGVQRRFYPYSGKVVPQLRNSFLESSWEWAQMTDARRSIARKISNIKKLEKLF